VRKKVIFHGRVQGVGFRAFCASEAARLSVRGWVRNLPDGTVEMEAEAAPAIFEALLARLKVGPPMSRVDRVDVREATPRRNEAESFDVTD
jgi:acylphosphatase